MKNTLKYVALCCGFFVGGILFARSGILAYIKKIVNTTFVKAKEVSVDASVDKIENFYDLILQRTLREKDISDKDKNTLEKIVLLYTTSKPTLEALVDVCVNPQKQISQELIIKLQAENLVDGGGKINKNNPVANAITEIAAHGKQNNSLAISQSIPTDVVIKDFIKIVVSFLAIQNKGLYQAGLLNFKFSFPSYRDLLQLFSESFFEKNYTFVSSKKEPFIIDCGSNLGMTILFFKSIYPGAEILGFEPSPISLSFLKKNISDNALNNVTIVERALSNKEGSFLFQENPDTTLGSRFTGDLNSGTIHVDSVLLSKYIKKPVDFIKIDVEGAETVIFSDLDKSGKIQLIKEMGIECHGKERLNYVLYILNKYDFVYQITEEELWGNAYVVHAFNRSL